jgi:hypothetical protein
MNCGGVVQKSCDINKLREVTAGYPGATYIVVRSIELGGQQMVTDRILVMAQRTSQPSSGSLR